MSFLTEYFDEYRLHPIRKTKMCRPENRWAQLEGKWLDPNKDVQDKAWSKAEMKSFIKATMKSLRGQSTYYNDYCEHLSPEFKTRPFVPRAKKKRPCKTEGTQVEEPAPLPPPAVKLAMKDTELMKVAKVLYEPDPTSTVLKPLTTHSRILLIKFVTSHKVVGRMSEHGLNYIVPASTEAILEFAFVDSGLQRCDSDLTGAYFANDASNTRRRRNDANLRVMAARNIVRVKGRTTPPEVPNGYEYSEVGVVVLGYARPSYFKTGISDYQNSIARLAYETVRDDRIPPYHAHNGCRPRWGLPPEGTRQPELDGVPFDGERLY